MTNRDTLVQTVSRLRELLQSLDDAGIGQDAALHISWAVDLLEAGIAGDSAGG